MLYVKFIAHPYFVYIEEEHVGSETFLLSNFLRDEVGSVDIAFKKWAINPERISNSSNLLFLNTVGNNKKT